MADLQCEQCGAAHPVNHFPDISGIGLTCEFCLAGEDAKKAKDKLIAVTKQMSGELLDVKDVNELLPKVKTVMSEIYANFGGPRGFASRAHWMIEELCKRKPMPAAAAQLMINLIRLHLSMEQTEQENNARDMTDEQIRTEQQLALMRITMEAAADPGKKGILFELLRRQGIMATEMTPEQQSAALVDQIKALDSKPT